MDKKINIFLDDCRFPDEANCSFTFTRLSELSGIDNEDWIIVRSVEEFKQALELHGMPDNVSFDHDLDYGKENVHIKEYFRACEQNRPLNRYVLKNTGLEAAQALIEFCKKNGLTLPKYFIHSANHLGADDILNELKQYEGFAKSLQSGSSRQKPSRYPC